MSTCVYMYTHRETRKASAIDRHVRWHTLRFIHMPNYYYLFIFFIERFQFSLPLESQLFILACNRPLFFSLLCCALPIWLLGDWSSVNNDEVITKCASPFPYIYTYRIRTVYTYKSVKQKSDPSLVTVLFICGSYTFVRTVIRC